MNSTILEIGFTVLSIALAGSLFRINQVLGQVKDRVTQVVGSAIARIPAPLRPVADELMDAADLLYRKSIEQPLLKGTWGQAMRGVIIALSDTKLSQEEVADALAWVRSQFDPAISLKKNSFAPNIDRLVKSVLED